MASSNPGAESSPTDNQKDKGPGSEKATRWRTACNACHDAKVRCSGERDGCARCRETGNQCIFLVSRVGKARGCRKRRNRIEATPTSSSADAGRSSNQVEAYPLVSQSSTVLSPTMPALDDDTFLSWSARIPGDTPPPETVDQLFGTSDVFGFHTEQTPPYCRALTGPRATDIPRTPPLSVNGPSYSSNPFSGFAVQPDNDLATLPPADNSARDPFAGQLRTHSHPPSDKGQCKDNDRCLIACAELVARLEARQRDGFFGMDEVLAMNREAADRINQLLFKGFAGSASSSVILTTAVEHVVSLFETGVRARPLSRHTVPAVGFGVFSIDPAEQETLRARIVSKELRFNAEVIHKLSTAIMEKRGSTYCKLRAWLQELEERMQNLISVIEEE